MTAIVSGWPPNEVRPFDGADANVVQVVRVAASRPAAGFSERVVRSAWPTSAMPGRRVAALSAAERSREQGRRASSPTRCRGGRPLTSATGRARAAHAVRRSIHPSRGRAGVPRTDRLSDLTIVGRRPQKRAATDRRPRWSFDCSIDPAHFLYI